MGLVDIQDDVLQGITDVADEQNVPVEDLIGTVIQDYTHFWENEKTTQELSEEQGLQGRKYKRQKTNWDDKFHFQFSKDITNKKIPGKLKDISINGLSFSFDDQDYVQEDLALYRQHLIVSFESPENKQIIQFRMKPRHIRREGNENIVGLAFSDDNCDYHDFVSFLHLVEQQAKAEREARV